MSILGALGDLVLALSADTAKFQSDLGRAQRMSDKFAKEVGRSLGNLAGIIGFVFSGRAIKDWIGGQIEAADAIGKTGQKVAMSTEALSGYIVQAKLANLSADELVTHFQHLAKNQSDYVAGVGEAKEAFAALGITQEEVKRLNGDNAKLFELVAGKLASFEDGANKTALAMRIFGRGGADLIPMINSLEETRGKAAALNAVIDKDTAAAANAFKDNIDEARIAVQAMGLNIAKALLPTLQTMSERLLAAAKDAQSMGNAGRIADTGLKLIASAGTIIATTFQIVGERLGAIFASLVAAGKGDMSGALRIQMESFGDAVTRVKDAVKSLDDTWNGGAPARRAFQADVRAIDNALRKGAAPALRDTAAEAKALKDAMKAAEDALRLEDMAMEDAIGASDALKDIAIKNEREREEAIKRVTDAQVESAEIAQQAAEDTVYTYDELGNRIEVTREQWEEMERQQKKNSEFAKEFGLTFSSALEDVIVKGGEASDMLKALEQDILRVITRKLVTEPLGDAISGAVKGAMGGSGIGDFFGKIFGGARAEGGPVEQGHAYLVGERGPEIMVPRSAGSVVPASAVGGRPIVINMNISTPNADSFRRNEAQISGDLAMAMARARRNT